MQRTGAAVTAPTATAKPTPKAKAKADTGVLGGRLFRGALRNLRRGGGAGGVAVPSVPAVGKIGSKRPAMSTLEVRLKRNGPGKDDSDRAVKKKRAGLYTRRSAVGQRLL